MGLVDCIKSSEANVLGRDLAEEDLLIELRILAVPGECGDDNSVPSGKWLLQRKGRVWLHTQCLLAAGAAHLAAPQQGLGAGQLQQQFTCSAGVRSARMAIPLQGHLVGVHSDSVVIWQAQMVNWSICY